jgi:Dyp-type peroxidase family
MSEAPVVTTEIEQRGVDPTFPEVREAPAVPLTAPTGTNPARPDASNEPILHLSNIQGNIVAGFNKDFQTLLFLRIDDSALFKPWLVRLEPLIATADEVLAFNRLFKRTRNRRGYAGSVKASWINIAFSHRGLSQLTDVSGFTDASFAADVFARSAALGDPSNEEAEGHPKHWLVGGEHNAADVIVIVAADTLADLEAEVAQVEQLLYSPRVNGRPVRCGATVIFKQEGRTQPGALAGHEHFGFLDGVSQPGLRGRISHGKHDVLTPRQNPDDPDQGKPGQDLLWPGEFIFGYPSQDPSDMKKAGPDSLTDGQGNAVAPKGARDGAYLVFRRLRQDVFKFHSFVNTQAAALSLQPDQLGSKLVGRWRSGAPVLRAPNQDDPPLGNDDCANNHFEFEQATPHTRNQPSNEQCTDITFPESPGDQSGDICPFSAHIRKSYPRDDVSQNANQYNPDEASHRLNENDTQTHRLLRRGIPFGPSSQSNPEAPVDDGVDRGLLFMAYMTSIVDQFEFVTEQWVNNANFKEPNTGLDPILGQLNNADGTRTRSFNVRLGGQDHSLSAAEDWVIPTGGGYFFAPSLKAIRDVLAR